jgi:hypothetical protein
MSNEASGPEDEDVESEEDWKMFSLICSGIDIPRMTRTVRVDVLKIFHKPCQSKW